MTNISADVFAEWGVVPEDVLTLSVSLFNCDFGFLKFTHKNVKAKGKNIKFSIRF